MASTGEFSVYGRVEVETGETDFPGAVFLDLTYGGVCHLRVNTFQRLKATSPHTIDSRDLCPTDAVEQKMPANNSRSKASRSAFSPSRSWGQPSGGWPRECLAHISQAAGRVSRSVRKPNRSFKRSIIFSVTMANKSVGGFACHVMAVKELSENKSLPRW